MKKFYSILLFFYVLSGGVLLAQEPVQEGKNYQHLIMYGQSMSTGAQSYPALSTDNVEGNYMIGDQVWIKQGNTNFQEFNPLKGTIAIGYQNQPKNRAALTFGETSLLGLTNHLQLKQSGENINYIASSDGENGKSIEVLSKQGVSGKQNYYSDYFQKSITSAYITAKSNKSTISSPAIFWLQGEYNYLNLYDDNTSGATSDKDSYKNLLLALKNDMQKDIMDIYGQSQKPVFITYQAGSIAKNKELTSIGLAELEASNTYDDIICSGPLYQMPHRGVHLDPNGYRWYGEMLAKVYYKTQVLKEDFKPLQPKKIYRIGSNQIGILFHVPVPPLVFDIQTLPQAQNYGFVVKKDGVRQTISTINISGNEIIITCTANLTGTVEVIYGEGRITTSTLDVQGTTQNTVGDVNYRFGNLRDSDNYPSYYTYLDLDKKVSGTYVYPRETSESTLHPYYEPKDQSGNVIYDKSYPLYNFSVSFGYSLPSGRTEVYMPGFFPKWDILYVKKGSNGDGSSWSSPLGEFADALKIAEEQNSGDAINTKQIWVAQGTYIPKYIAGNGTNPTNDRSFVLPRNVEIYGGFTGTETSVSQRDWKNNLTILSGDVNGNDGANFTNVTDNTYHVVISAGDLGNTILDGFTIKGGNAGLSGNYSYTVNGKMIFTGYGGGLYVSGSAPKLNNLIVSNNRAVESGGGMVIDVSSPVLTNVTISDNKIDGTKSVGGGGIYNYQSSSTLTNVNISNNKIESSNTNILGGGIYNYQSPATKFTNVVISGNSTVLTTQALNGYGGGIFNKQSPITMINTLIMSNKAKQGGGMFIENSNTSKLINTTISGNQAETASALYNHSMTIELYNSIVWNNTPANASVGSYSGTPVYNYSLVQGVTNTSNNNIAGTTDPLFINTASSDYRLQSTSPLINKGNNNYPLSANLDLDGNPRIISGIVDFGAYEYLQELNCSWEEMNLTDTEVTYDGNPHSVTIDNLPADVTVTYTYKGTSSTTYAEQTQAPTNAGNYIVTATVIKTTDSNCQIILTALLNINKAPAIITSESIQVFTFNDNLKNITASLNHNEASLIYSPQQGYTNAGTYPITVSAPEISNYLAVTKTISLVIHKANFTGITLSDNSLTYDGASHSLAVNGTLPTGTTVTYGNNGKVNAGTYLVTATVTNPNYNDLVLTANLIINKADFAGIILNDNSFTYDGNPHSLTVSGTLPTGTTVTYENNGKVNIGTYLVKATLTNPNYNDLELTANLIINKAPAIITADDTQTYTYDGSVKNVVASLNHSETTLNYSPQQGYTDTGTYPVVVSAPETDNYLAVSKTINLVINKADITGITFSNGTFTYDGSPHSLAITGTPPAGTTVTYGNNNQTNAGTYSVTATLTNPNYNNLVLTANLIINKAQTIITADDTQTYTYDGSVKNVVASLNHSETTLNYSPQQGYSNAGTYPVIVSAPETANYLAVSKTISLVINKATITGITFSNGTFTYDGTPHSLTITGTPPAGTTVTYENNNQTNAGTYSVTATLTNPNYNNLILTANLTINKINFTGITFNDNSYAYDGTPHSLAITGTLPTGSSVAYLNNNQTNAGTYLVKATLTNPNYNNLELTANLIINKATFTGITLSDNSFTYDGTSHGLAITGTLPTGSSVAYLNNNQTNAGTYLVKATLTNPKYNNLELTANLIINKATFTGITLSDNSFTYNGSPRSLTVSGTLPTGTTVTYGNNGKVNVGTYLVTATLTNPNYNNLELTANLIINKAQAIITATDTQNFAYNGSVKNVVASLNHSETSLTYSPQQGYTNVGTYPITISAIETANYLAVTKTISLVIDKGNFSGVTLNNGTFTYNGSPHSLAIGGTSPAGTTVTYGNNGKVNAGTYLVTATLTNPNYNDLSLSANLIINKAQTIITAANTQTHTYDGSVKNVVASLNHSETTLNYSPQQGYTDTGTYSITVSANETTNYLGTNKEVELVIEDVRLNVDDPETIKVKTIKVAPNPVSTVLKVFFPEPVSGKETIKLYDLMGQLVWEGTITPGTTVKEIDFRYFYSGTYILKYKNTVVKIIRD